MEVCTGHWLSPWGTAVALRESTGRLKVKGATSCSQSTIFTLSMTDTWTVVIQRWAFGWYVLKNEPSELLTSGKTPDPVCCQWWNLSFQEKKKQLKILESCIWFYDLVTFQILKGTFVVVNGDINKCGYLISCHEVCWSFKDLHDLGNQKFPNDQHIL